MHVVATAGHVDHGKSTLVRALTGMEPDRWGEEHRRGLTIDLGFVWTEVLGQRFAFVDVPGHQRFVPNMLAGVGSVPAAMLVVAADDGWMPQSSEHLAALDAFGVRHGLLVVTKSDRADPEPALHEARDRIGRTSLGDVPAVVCSAHSGIGLERVREELGALAERLPQPDPAADVRLWVDRSFTVRGAGTVVTGTLGAGSLHVGQQLELAGTGERVTVRGLQSLGSDTTTASAVARVALNLRNITPERIDRGAALLTPQRWVRSSTVDVRLRGLQSSDLHRESVLHIGSAAVAARARALGTDTARLTLADELPLRAGDTGLLRDPGEHRVAGTEVLDIAPSPLRGRGAAQARAEQLAAGQLAADQIRRRAFIAESELTAMGLTPTGIRVAGWAVDPEHWQALPKRAVAEFDAWTRDNPLAAGMPAETLRERFGLPLELFRELLATTELTLADGLVGRPGGAALPQRLRDAVRELQRRFAQYPFRAPEAHDLAELGLGARELAAAARAGELTRVAEGVVLGPDAFDQAAQRLAEVEQPFTVSQARQALGTTRRVAVPLLERLDADGVTKPEENSSRRYLLHAG